MILRGLELKKKRENLGLTQTELGGLLGKTMRTVISWEQSEQLSQSQILQIESVFLKYEKNSHSQNIVVNEKSEVYKTKSGNIIDELPNGKYLLTVPLLPYKAHATYISEFQDAEYISNLTRVSFIVDRVPKGAYMAFEIMNDSMNDATLEHEASRSAILNGDIVLGRELGKQHWKSKLNTNGYPFWIIIHKDTIVCKEIIKHDVEKGIITCHSLNNSPEFQDFDLNLDDCYQLFNIIKKQI